MDDKRKRLIEALAARAKVAKEKAIAEGKETKPIVMNGNPRLAEFIARAKAKGANPKMANIHQMSREQMMELFKNKIKKSE